MTPSFTDYHNDQLRDYVDGLRVCDVGAGDLAIESDKDVYRLLAAMDRFRIVNEYPFDFSDPDQEPPSDIMREIVTTLTSSENASIVDGYYERHCSGTRMNPLAEQTWSYLRARQRMAEQERADQPATPSCDEFPVIIPPPTPRTKIQPR